MNPEKKFLIGALGVMIAAGCLCGSGMLLAAGLILGRNTDSPVSGTIPTSAGLPSSTGANKAVSTQLPADPPQSMATPTATPSVDPAFVGSEGIGDPYFPNMGNGGYDVASYELDIRVDMEVEEISAVATISARALQALGRFNLDFKQFDILSLRVNGEEGVFSQAEDELVLTPARMIPANSEFTVEIAYRGRPGGGKEYGGIEFLEGWNFYPGGVIVAGEPTGAETWFPSNNHPADKAAFTFRITVPEPYVAAANGVLQESGQNGDRTRTFVWKMEDPMATYLATIAVGDFDLLEGTSRNGRPFRNFVHAGIRDEMDPGVDALPEAMDFFSEIFGPYPFATCGIVLHPIDLPFALENQTLIVMGYTFAYGIVVVHETSHQWFGDSVSLASWKDIWLNEGFASYAEGLWWEREGGASALKEDLSRRYRFLANLPEREVNLLGDPGPDHLFDPEVYYRGALTLHALRLNVGDEAFFRILQTYFRSFRHGNATTEEFIDLAEEISHRDLSDFFKEWLYEYPLPDLPELDLYS
ncbi:MAG: M1 family metallopeptidase [Anaerolineales bacterium]|nr:M1 family metallopeptidase [Anaerolineales bacterium]